MLNIYLALCVDDQTTKKVNNLNLMSMISDERPNSLTSIEVTCYDHYSGLNLKDSKEFILNLRLIKKDKLKNIS